MSDKNKYKVEILAGDTGRVDDLRNMSSNTSIILIEED